MHTFNLLKTIFSNYTCLFTKEHIGKKYPSDGQLIPFLPNTETQNEMKTINVKTLPKLYISQPENIKSNHI